MLGTHMNVLVPTAEHTEHEASLLFMANIWLGDVASKKGAKCQISRPHETFLFFFFYSFKRRQKQKEGGWREEGGVMFLLELGADLILRFLNGRGNKCICGH